MTKKAVASTDIRVHTGIGLRRESRERKVDFVRRVTENAIEEYLTGLSTPNIPYDDYDRDLKQLLAELESWASNTNDLKIARAHLARLIHQHNLKFGASHPIPPPLARLFPDRPLRTQSWSDSRRRLNQAHEAWLKGLDAPPALDLSADLRLGQFLYTAATYGGLCRPAAIENLADAMQTARPIKSHRGLGLQWIDLYFRNGKFTNSNDDNGGIIYEPWLLTPMCKMTAFGFLKHRHRCSWHDGGERPAAFDLISTAFQHTAGVKLPFPSLKKFLRVAFCVVERQPGAAMPEVLAGYSIGRVSSMSLQPAAWQRMLASVPASAPFGRNHT